MPKAHPAAPAPAPASKSAIMQPIEAIMRGISARDSAALAAQLRPDADVTVAVEGPDGKHVIRHLSASQFSGSVQPGPEHLEARLGKPDIRVDGDIAMVWVGYSFLIDGKVDHCGVNHFDLVREENVWKVQNVTWSSRKSRCA
jgi:ketosteroid isomerase-like protein